MQRPHPGPANPVTIRQRIAAAVAVAVLAAGGLAPAAVAAGSGAGVASAAGSPSGAPAPVSPGLKLRGDLADFVAGTRSQDGRIAGLVPGWRSGEIAYFAVLGEPDDAAHGAVVAGLGARILRSYRSVEAFALASDATTVLRVAALPWVTRLEPIEVVVPLADEPLADQTRGTPHDVGADALWAQGILGQGVRIAVLDTGYDPLHPDLDDLDFRHWSSVLNPPKVVDARNFNGGGCAPLAGDGHGHGTHVASIAAGTGEGGPTNADDGRYAGVAPGAELAIGKVLTDAGAGINSDLIAALEWAAMPAEPGLTGCAVGADVVNLSLGSEARPARLNSGADVDLVSQVANGLAVRYGTLIVAAVGNSGPYIGSALEAPGSASQVLSVAAAAKDWDLNHDDTASGDTCSGWVHPRGTSAADNDCRAGAGTQGSSVASFSSRGPSGDLWLRPDLAAPGYNIVAAQASTGSALAGNDYNRNTRGDPLYATASGTSMATPATAGSAALLLAAYRAAHAGLDPTGPSGVPGGTAPAYVLLRAALMNSAASELYESRWILTLDAGLAPHLPARRRSAGARLLRGAGSHHGRDPGRDRVVDPVRGPQRGRRPVRRAARRGRRQAPPRAGRDRPLERPRHVQRRVGHAARPRAPAHATSRAAGRSARSPPAPAGRSGSSSAPRPGPRPPRCSFSFAPGHPSDGSQRHPDVRERRLDDRPAGHDDRRLGRQRRRRRSRSRCPRPPPRGSTRAPSWPGPRPARSSGSRSSRASASTTRIRPPATRRVRRPGSPRTTTSSPRATRSGPLSSARPTGRQATGRSSPSTSAPAWPRRGSRSSTRRRVTRPTTSTSTTPRSISSPRAIPSRPTARPTSQRTTSAARRPRRRPRSSSSSRPRRAGTTWR